MKAFPSSILIAIASLVVSGTALGERPATLIGQVTRDGEPIANARIEALIPSQHDIAFVCCPVSTNRAGRFVLTGLPASDRYQVRITFPGGAPTYIGYVDDVRAGDVRYISSTHQYLCGTTYWHESQLAPHRVQRVFVWPPRERRNSVSICE